VALSYAAALTVNMFREKYDKNARQLKEKKKRKPLGPWYFLFNTLF